MLALTVAFVLLADAGVSVFMVALVFLGVFVSTSITSSAEPVSEVTKQPADIFLLVVDAVWACAVDTVDIFVIFFMTDRDSAFLDSRGVRIARGAGIDVSSSSASTSQSSHDSSPSIMIMSSIESVSVRDES